MSANKKPVNRVLVTVELQDGYYRRSVVYTRSDKAAHLHRITTRILNNTPNAKSVEAEYLAPVCSGF